MSLCTVLVCDMEARAPGPVSFDCVTVSLPRLRQVMLLFGDSGWSVLHYPSVCLSVSPSLLLCVCLYSVCSRLPFVLLLLFLLLLVLSPGLFSLWYLQIGGVWGGWVGGRLFGKTTNCAKSFSRDLVPQRPRKERLFYKRIKRG